MLTTTRANILKTNHSTTAIAKHLSFSLSLLPLYRHYTVPYFNVKEKKSWKKYFFVAQDLLMADLAQHLL
jgi:hypothetical protein